MLYFYGEKGNVHRLFESCILDKYSGMVSRQYVFANGFLVLSAISAEKGLMCRHTQFTTVSEHFTTIGALVWFLAPVAAFMAVQGGLTGEYLAADGAFEVFIYYSISMRYTRSKTRMEREKGAYNCYASKSVLAISTFAKMAHAADDIPPSSSSSHYPWRHPQSTYGSR